MKTSLTAFILIAIIGLGTMAFISYDSSVTGQGVKIIKPTEAMKKAMEEPKKDFPGQPIFTGRECIIYREIYRLRKEVNLPNDHLESTKEYCIKIGYW